MTSTATRARHAKPGQLSAARRPAFFGPRAVLAFLALFALVGVMLFNGYLHAELGDDDRVRENAASDRVPNRVLRGGSTLAFPNGKARSRPVPRKTVALTFDDGPDPKWTPKILAILEKYDVPGTFFVVGSMSARYPDAVREIVDGENELGIHTFTHVDLSYQSPERVDREIAQTQLALAGAAGVNTSLFRAPYSSTPDAVDNYSWPVYRRLGNNGYTSAFVDTDSEDWQNPGVSKIVENATPEGAKGASVLFHDSGGDRSQTLRALPEYIQKMKARGYTFTTVSEAMRQPSAHRPVAGPQSWQGKALVSAIAVAEYTVPGLVVGLTIVGVAVLGRSALMLVLARRHHRQRNRRRLLLGPGGGRAGERVVPAYNEKECIANTLTSLARSTHPIEIIVVDDGSTDGTPEIGRSARPAATSGSCGRRTRASPPPSTTVFAHARYDIVVMMDGDTVFEPDTVHQLVQPFADPARRRGRGQRQGRQPQHPHRRLAAHRVRDGLQPRPAHVRPAALHAHHPRRRSAPSAATPSLHTGGMSEDTLAEDTDVTIALQRAAGGSCTPSTPSPGPKRRAPCVSCGGSATAGATARCRPSGSIAGPSSTAGRRDGSAGSACPWSSSSRSSRRSWLR